MTVIID